MLVAAGKAAAAGVIAAPAAALSEGVLKAMFLIKLKTAVTVLMTFSAVTVGGGTLAYRLLAAEPAAKLRR